MCQQQSNADALSPEAAISKRSFVVRPNIEFVSAEPCGTATGQWSSVGECGEKEPANDATVDQRVLADGQLTRRRAINTPYR